MKLKSFREGLAVAIIASLMAANGGCEGPTAGRNDLGAMNKAALTINNVAFEVWIAKETQEITLGLMQVDESELAPTPAGAERGMLFVFDDDRPRGFWMFNTPTALDIAYIRSDGRIVRIWTMQPLDTGTYPSGEAAQYALEVRAGRFAELGIFEGDQVTLPENL